MQITHLSKSTEASGSYTRVNVQTVHVWAVTNVSTKAKVSTRDAQHMFILTS